MIKVVVLISVKRTFVVQCTPPRVPHMLTSVSVLRDSRLSCSACVRADDFSHRRSRRFVSDSTWLLGGLLS
jgi:hypothetical protein